MYMYTNKFSNVKKTAVAIKEYFSGNIFYYSYFIFLLFLFYPSNKKVIVLFFGFFYISFVHPKDRPPIMSISFRKPCIQFFYKQL